MANQITLLRVVLAIYVIYLLYQTSPASYVTALILTVIVILLDGLDGYVARAMKEESKTGALIDILGDRIVENIYWIAFAVIGWIGLWIPLLVVIRGIVTDGVRTLAFEQGKTAFGEDTMAKSSISKMITSSRCTRFLYGAFKALAFMLLILVHIPNMEYWDPMSINDFILWLHYLPVLTKVAYGCVYLAVIFCVIRAIPVIIESKHYFKKADEK